MNIEQLSKSQIILLTLLVSFVTSIATGIVTVSLMEQAPPAIAQTVNRVIERTVQTVVPSSQTAAASVTTERTVVVKETDLIAKAITKVSPSIVKLYAGAAEDATFLGLGVVLDDMGTIASDVAALGDAKEVSVSLSDGTRVKALLEKSNKASGLVFLQATSTGTTTVAWKPATVAATKSTLGQTVVVLYGKSAVRVEDGIVTALLSDEEKDAAKDSIIDTSISAESITFGSPLFNTEGEVIGVSTSASRASSSKGFTPSSALIQKPEGKSAENGSAAQ